MSVVLAPWRASSNRQTIFINESNTATGGAGTNAAALITRIQELTADYVASATTADPVNQALLKLGIGVANVESRVRGQQLTPQQYNDYATIAGRMLHSRLETLVQSQVFNRSPPSLQHDLVAATISQSRETARGWLFARYPGILQAAQRAKINSLTRSDQ